MPPLVALLLAVSASCHDPNADPADDGGIDWQTCPLYVEGKDKPLAQCATVAVPLRHDAPDGDTVELFVQRRLGDGATRQVWMLAGGPGQPGSVFEGYIDDLSRADPATDWYTLDHRGVGRSTRLSCPDAEDPDSADGIDVAADEWPGCLAALEAEWGEDLAAFSSTEAARDLEALITRTEAGDVFVYGGSYGTTLAHRFLQRFPDRVDGVVLDSVAIDVDHRVYDAEYDAVGREFMAFCAADKVCAEALGDDPYTQAKEVLAAMADGHCPDVAVDADGLREAAGAFLPDVSMRGFIPALFARVDRCTDDDVEELNRLVALFTDRPDHYIELQTSPALFANIELSEQWPEPWPDPAALEGVVAEAVFSFGLGPRQRPLLDVWPRYAAPDAALAVTDTPMLILQGGLDPQTPLARTLALADHFDGAAQHLVVFPTGGHLLLGASAGRGGDCATALMLDFLDDPTAPPEASCAETAAEPKFRGQGLTSQLLFTDWSRYGGCGCDGGGGGAGWAAAGLLVALRRRRSGSPGRSAG